MAGDWLKVEVATPDKPEIWLIAEALQIDPDAVVGKLFRVWAWFDQQTENGNAPTVTKMLLDRKVGVTGFCDAVIQAGWMEEKGSLILPNFDRHNGQTAKNRALTAKRVKKHKETNAKGNDGSVTEVTDETLPKEEKRREEKKGNNKSTAEAVDYSVFGFSDEYMKEIKRIRKKNKGGAITQRVANTLAKEIHQAMKNGWTIDDILNEWEYRGWKAFKAEWMKGFGQGQAPQQATLDHDSTDWIEGMDSLY